MTGKGLSWWMHGDSPAYFGSTFCRLSHVLSLLTFFWDFLGQSLVLTAKPRSHITLIHDLIAHHRVGVKKVFSEA